MGEVLTLTRDRRNKMLAQLSQEQVDALRTYMTYCVRSIFHTNNYLIDTDWDLIGIEYDPYFHRSRGYGKRNLHCECGRPLKWQFNIRSRKNKRVLKLGITHFQEHAGIPANVAKEIYKGVNRINEYQDQILIKYTRGVRFQARTFDYIVRNGGFDGREHTIIYQKGKLQEIT